MFDKLDDLLIRYEELMSELQEPDVANDANRFRKLMKEQSDLAPIVEAYTEYKNAKQAIIDSEEMLEMETDEEMRELAKEELYDSKKRVEELEHELKIKTLWLKSEQVPEEMSQHCLRQKYIVCMYTMQKADIGRQK